LGEELSIHLFHSNPAFLSLAFALGSQRVVTWQSVAIAAGGGMLAAIVAVLSPLRDILARDPLAAIAPRERTGTRPSSGRRRSFAGLACLGAATALLLAAPDAAIPGMVLLVAALLLELPIVLSTTLTLVKRVASLIVSPIPHVATMELSAARALSPSRPPARLPSSAASRSAERTETCSRAWTTRPATATPTPTCGSPQP